MTPGLVEDEFEKLLLTAGRELADKHAKEISGAMGPLHGFSAKIEIAYMFEVIDKSVRDDLQIIKSIRNKFAHTTRFVFFESPHIDRDSRRLSNWNEVASNEEIFRARAIECINAIKSKINELMYMKALKEPLSAVDDD